MGRNFFRMTAIASLLAGGALFAACGDSGGTVEAPDAWDAMEVPDGLVEVEDVAEGVDEETGSNDVEALVEEGKAWLRDGEAGFAIRAFEEAVALEPDHTDALFGVALSEMVYASELFVMAVSLAGQFSEPEPLNPALLIMAPEPPPDDWTQNEYLASEIHRILVRIRDHFVTASDTLSLIEGLDLDFNVEAVPVYLGIKPKILYRGVFDAGDVYLMGAVSDTVIGIIDVLAGQDLTTDVLTMVGFFKAGITGGGIDAKAIFEIVAYLLLQDERFLTLHATEGLTLFNDSRDRFGAAGPRLLAGLEKAQELGDGPDEVSLVESITGPTKVLRVRSRVIYDGEGVASEEDFVFHLTDDILQAFQDASNSILNPGQPVTLHGAVLPILAVMVSLASQASILEVVGLDLPIDIGAFEIPGVVGLLASLMPNVMAFDWGAFYENPAGLRAWLPAITSDLGLFKDTVIAEWECPDDLDENGYPQGQLGLLCSGDAELKDQGHFEGTDFEIAADGLASGFPVFAFEDPTLNGLAMVDLDGETGSADASSFVVADGAALNAALATLLEGILALIP